MKILDVNLPPLIISPEIRLEMNLKKVSEKHRISIWKMKARNRDADVVKARVDFSQMCIGFSNPTEIGRVLNKDRSTIYHYLEEYTCDS